MADDNRHLTAASALGNGRYAITRKLGEGGQGTTFEAVDKRAGRLVTVKRFRVKGATSWKEVELAEREAKVLASLSHPLIPTYVEHFEEEGSLYLVTERVEGASVDVLRKRGGMSEKDVLRWLADASKALDYLHGRTPPIVHRDIKPSNVIRRPDGSFVLIDFGAVRDKLKPSGGSTVVGTFGYMAPEQFQGRALPASDVYAVGATAIAMWTGLEPEDLPHKGLAIDVASALGRSAPPDVIEVLRAMVEPDPDVRPGRIAPLLDRLGGLRASGRGASVEDETPAPSSDRRDRKRDRRRAEKEARKEEKRSRRARDNAEPPIGPFVEEARRAEQEAEIVGREAAATWRRGASPLGGPILWVVLLALTLAQVAVLLTLKAVVPVVLHVLAGVLFWGSTPGKAMHRAAAAVSAAGSVAAAGIGRAKEAVRGRAPAGSALPGDPIRVEFKPRFEAKGGEQEAEEAPSSAAEREAAAEAEASRDDKKRRKSP